MRVYAALASLAFSWAKAQSSQCVSASTSARLDRRAAPDAQAGRRVAIGADVEGDLLLFEQARRAPWRRPPARRPAARRPRGSTTFRQTLVFERVAGPRARKSTQGVLATQSAIALALASARAISAVEAADRLRPLQRVEIILDAQHRRRVDRLALEDAFDQLAALGHAEQLGQRPGGLVGLEPLDRARAQDDHAVRRLAAERLLPGEGDDVELGPIEVLREGGGGRVADRQALAVGGDPVGVGHAHAGGRAVPGEDDVVVEIDLASRSGSSP